jgi:hypothetical protein
MLRRDPDVAVAIDELRDHDLLVPLQRRGAHGEETIYGIAPWFHDVIGPALVFTGHESPSEEEAERVMRALSEVGFVSDKSTDGPVPSSRPKAEHDASPAMPTCF